MPGQGKGRGALWGYFAASSDLKGGGGSRPGGKEWLPGEVARGRGGSGGCYDSWRQPKSHTADWQHPESRDRSQGTSQDALAPKCLTSGSNKSELAGMNLSGS